MIPLDRRPPFRSQILRDAARGQACVHCGSVGTTVGAHYSGVRRGSYGGGLGEKVHDFLIAHLCATCHVAMDTLCKDKEDRWINSEIFLHAIALTLERLFVQGVIQVRGSRHRDAA